MGGMVMRWGWDRVCLVSIYPPGRASTKRFLFRMMPKRREWARSVSESSSDLNRE